MTFEPLRVNNDYEISVDFPHVIRKKANGRIIKESIGNQGYLQLNLFERVNGRTVKHSFYKHRIIANQFIENPNDLECVDHINRNKLDNRIENETNLITELKIFAGVPLLKTVRIERLHITLSTSSLTT